MFAVRSKAVALMAGVSLVLAAAGVRIGNAQAEKQADSKSQAPSNPGEGRLKPTDGGRAQVRELLQEAVQALLDPTTGTNNTLQARGVAQCARLQARAGDSESSRRTLRHAKALIEAMVQLRATRGRGPGPEYFDDLWRMLASSYAEAGEIEELRTLLDALPDHVRDLGDIVSSSRAIVIRESALALAKIGKLNEALELLKGIKAGAKEMYTPEDVRNEVLSENALHHARAGNLNEARQAVDRIPDAAYKVRALAGTIWTSNLADVVWSGRPSLLMSLDLPDEPGIALLQNEAGDAAGARETLKQASEVARTIDDSGKQAYGRAVIACAQARVGDLDGALATLDQISTGSKSCVYALVAIAKAQAAAGHAVAAREAIDKLKTTPQQSRIFPPQAYGLAQLAIGQAQAGDLRAARASAEQALQQLLVLPQPQRNSCLHMLALFQARAKDFEGALATASRIQGAPVLFDARRVGTAYINLAYEEAKAGAGTRALDIVKGLRPGSDQLPRALQATARGRTERGEEKEALAWARQLATPDARGFALLGVAEALLQRPKAAGAPP
jgi:tetratricopeptide (TPR) repeat protein